MIKVLVTGANGQLGQCLQKISEAYSNIAFTFVSSSQLNITNKEQVATHFNNHQYNYCINCAAYTAVDAAETNTELANKVNTLGAQYIAIACAMRQVKLLHVSTDFVFNGESTTPYKETDTPNPASVYGQTKLAGERLIAAHIPEHFIIRTSWLYSEFASNFMKTMLRLASERDTLGVVSDQVGSPTNANDLAAVLLKIVTSNTTAYGLYHYSNQGTASWCDFATEIFAQSGVKIQVNPIPSTAYPTPAARPKYSVLNTAKIKTNLDITIPFWKESLQTVLQTMKADKK